VDSNQFKISDLKCVFYTSAVGSLMYAMLCTLSNISQVVSVVSRFLPNPVKEYWEAVEWILRYLKGTIDICLSFGGDTCPLHDFVESNYVGDIDRRRSNIGYLFKIYGVLVNCRSMLQATLVLSTTKVHPDENLADMLTEVVLGSKFQHYLNLLSTTSYSFNI
jgi:hypothetical protein